jgi:hypothetical protein
VLFSTGGANLANSRFVGNAFIADLAHEGEVQQIVAAGATFTAMRCWMNGTSASNLTFTLRVNGANSGLTCTITAGQSKGSGTGTAVVVAGDLLDVATPSASTPGQPGSFAISG